MAAVKLATNSNPTKLRTVPVCVNEEVVDSPNSKNECLSHKGGQ